jgi:hypothetical protein
MDKLIKNVLNEYFLDFKEYHLIILVTFTIIIALTQIFQSIYISKKIALFKNDLKKSEIKFSRYNELQINALRKIYHHLALFQLSNNLLFNTPPETLGHDKYKALINSWIKIYIECSNEFSKEKILLTHELKTLFLRTLTDFEIVKKILKGERENLEFYEMSKDNDWQAMYAYEHEEYGKICSKIKRVKQNKSIQHSSMHIEELKAKIEELFLTMN